jgi:hypothetical protein
MGQYHEKIKRGIIYRCRKCPLQVLFLLYSFETTIPSAHMENTAKDKKE